MNPRLLGSACAALMLFAVAAEATTAKFIPLTRPDGRTTYVLPGMVIDIYPRTSMCDERAKTEMRTLAGILCVRETPEEAVEKMKDGL